jgi:hypothetical protein
LAGIRTVKGSLALAEPHGPPNVDELEISVFGRGVGECIVVHLGASVWAVVDSHRVGNSESAPVALAYLAAISVDSDDVRLIAATHWDRDHIAGLSAVVAKCTRANFMCTGAIAHPDFLKQLALVAPHEGPVGPGAREFKAILDILDARGKGVMWANRLSRLRVGSCEVAAVAPSERTQTDALRRSATDPAHLPVEPTPNDTSLVLWFEVERVAILLGADLERGTVGTGWQAVLATFQPENRAGVFKVPHHGSPDADWPPVWERLLLPQPHSGVTAYAPSGRPRPADATRIRAASIAHFTGSAGTRRVRRSNHVERMVRSQTANGVQKREGAIGHVRLRREVNPAATWTVSYGGAARPL